jgi:HAD superfamily hydrolase (TIGR01490 family)
MDALAGLPVLASSSTRPACAFFDVDNTIVRGASGFHLAKELYRRRFFRRRDIAWFAWQAVQFFLFGEDVRRVTAVRARALGVIRGRTEAEILEVGEEVYETVLDSRIFPGARALVAAHLERGHQVWLVTATPQIIAQVIADRLGLSGALGTLVEVDGDGCFTGRLLEPPLHGARKGLIAREMVERLGADLDECWAYSDSINDLPLLESVGNRVVVNPDAELAAKARERGWDALTFARDSVKAAKRRVREHTRVHGRLPRVSAATRRAARGA